MPVQGLLGPGARLLPWRQRDVSGCQECMGGIIHRLAAVGFYRQGWSDTPEGLGMSPLRESQGAYIWMRPHPGISEHWIRSWRMVCLKEPEAALLAIYS